MKEDPVEPIMRYGAQLLGAVEAAMLPEDRKRLRSIEARGGELLLSLNRRGEVWASVVVDGRVAGIPFLLTSRGIAVTMNLPRWTVQHACS